MPFAPPVSSVAASTALTNTTTPTKFSTQKTIKADSLRAGDIVRVHFQGIATATNSTDTLAVKLFIGTVEVMAIVAVDVADGDIFAGECDVVIRTIGASGTCVASGSGGIGATGIATSKRCFKASQAIDTTVDNAVAVEGTWSVANAGNSCRLDILSVQVLRAEN